MKKNSRSINIVIIIVAIIIMNFITFKFIPVNKEYRLAVEFNLTGNNIDEYQFFFSEIGEFTVEKSEYSSYNTANKEQKMKYYIPKESTKIRFDIGTQPTNAIISDVRIAYFWKSVDITQLLKRPDNIVNALEVKEEGKRVYLESTGKDGYIIVNLENSIINELVSIDKILNNGFKIGICMLMNCLLFILFKIYKPIMLLIQEVYNNRRLMWSLAKNDFKTKYAGSYLGVFWAFVQPVITVLIYWFVFQVGFRTPSVQDFPFILWLVAGLVPWFFFSEAINNATNAMIEYSYLVKKVVFKISILPIVKILSALFIHLFFIIFAIILFAFYGYTPTWYTLQVIYYTICMFVLVLGIAYATSAIIVFFKDLGQIVAIILQVGVWMTPIMWDYNIIPIKYQWIFKLNPMYYIVEGYRDSLINHVGVWERYNQTIYFWTVAIILFGVGSIIFKKLKNHFSDVL